MFLYWNIGFKAPKTSKKLCIAATVSFFLGFLFRHIFSFRWNNEL